MRSTLLQSNLLQSNFSERSSYLQNKTQIFMDQIKQLEEEMKNQLMSTKIDVKNLQDARDYNIKETQINYENKINENINEHVVKEKKLLQTLEDQQKRIDYINERN
jgi:hypothetical protein